jgi:hypothetical protein
MTHKIWPRVLSWLMMVSMAISLSSPGAVPTTASGLFTNPQSQPAQSNVVAAAQNPNTQITTASDTNLKKFDSALQGLARAGGNDMVMARVLVSPDFKNWPGYVQALPLALPDDETGLPVYYARLQAGNLAKMASLKDVVYASVIEKTGPVPRFRDPDQSAPTVTDAMRARLKDLRDHPVTGPQSPASTGGWWDVGPNHESKLAWAKGFTGNGVTVADIDSGVDFCHADLYGTWKTYDSSAAHSYTYAGVPNYLDYYNGWPEMLSPVSNYLLFFDTYFNGQMTDQNTFLYGISKFADTRTSGVGDTISFDGNVYITTGTAFPGTAYHIGYHPDTSLERLWWGERIAVMASTIPSTST